MEAAFEAALADARAQNVPEKQEEKAKEPEEKVEEPQTTEAKDADATETDFKGELDAVWESLKPEAERLNKLAEWESEFSQVGGGGREGVGVGSVKEGVGGRVSDADNPGMEVDTFQEWRQLLLERERALADMISSRRSSISQASDQLRPMTRTPPPPDGAVRSVYGSDIGSDRQCSCSSCELEQQLGIVESALPATSLSSSSLPLSYSRTLQRGEVRSGVGVTINTPTPLRS